MAYDPNTPPPQNPQSTPRRGGGGGAWVWIVVLIIAGIIIWIAFSWSGNNYRANTVNRTNSPYDRNGENGSAQPATTANGGSDTGSSQGSAATIHSVSQLTQGNGSSLVGQAVALRNVKVAQVGRTGAFLIDGNGKPVLVVPASAVGAAAETGASGSSAQNGNAAPSAGGTPTVKEGESVNIQGTVEKAPSKNELVSQYHLSGAEAARAEQPGIYISALNVAPAE